MSSEEKLIEIAEKQGKVSSDLDGLDKKLDKWIEVTDKWHTQQVVQNEQTLTLLTRLDANVSSLKEKASKPHQSCEKHEGVCSDMSKVKGTQKLHQKLIMALIGTLVFGIAASLLIGCVL